MKILKIMRNLKQMWSLYIAEFPPNELNILVKRREIENFRRMRKQT